ncbi:hypothetical protein SAMN05421693_13220 [Ectothiorhodospira magna]|uniref:Replication initiator protein A n=1 Tax=Ectothiorhodospira magna TaxID=867345 RepID=A0A1H9G3T9_9GAMM|nr:hypothetical protein [Ectothiorhodospira magna]SEQ44825.1 hypothetical protein SAMN05421693_13220 [Ectothiorhodospira magna]
MSQGKSKQGERTPSGPSFNSMQLQLFQSFLCNSKEEREALSNTIEFWDSVPKYFVSRQEMSKMRSPEGHLPKIERFFNHGGRAFSVKLRPARITDKSGKELEYYPSAREELVEDALRKIATEPPHGFFEDHPDHTYSGVCFSVYMLRQELAKRGHTLSFPQVVEALAILVDAGVEVLSSDGKCLFKSTILTTLMGVSKTDLKSDPKARWYANFCPLVTEGIRTVSYRQYDYHTMMQHRSHLARWLHKRISHNFTQANHHNTYEVLFSTVKQDSGLLEYARERDGIRKLEEALQDLKDARILRDFTVQERRGPKNRLMDVLFQLYPHPLFIRRAKAANKRQSDSRKILSDYTRGPGRSA